MSRLRWNSPLLLLLLLGCSSSSSDESGTTPHEACAEDYQCQDGRCVAGTCVPDEDATSLFDGGAQKDTTGDASAEDTAPAPDTDEDAPATPDTATPDTGEPPKPDSLPTDAPIIMVDPTSYTFTYVEGDASTLTKDITITNMGQGELFVSSITWRVGSSAEYFWVSYPSTPAVIPSYQQATIKVGFIPGAAPGTAVMEIASNDPNRAVTEVSFDAFSKINAPDPTPCIQVYPTALNFGQVVRGDTKELSFNIKNCDPGIPLVITKIDRGSSFFGSLTDEFQLVPEPGYPWTIPPGQSMPQVVSYTPGLAGIDAGHWVVKSTDPNNPQVKVNVSGTGVPPPLEEIALHIELTWSSNDCDVDLHLLRPGATFFDCQGDCHYQNMAPDWGTANDIMDDPFLDYDNVQGLGPEHINISEPQAGIYTVVIHYYSDSYDGSGGTSTDATLKIYMNGVLKETFGPTHLSETNMTWDVCEVDWPSGTITALGSVYKVSSSDINACFNW
jgi:hypothetical protein